MAGLVGLVILAVVVLSIAGGVRLSKTHDVQAEAITIPDHEVAVARGEHLVKAVCTSGSHGDKLSGQAASLF